MATIPVTEERPKQEISREPRIERKVPHRKGRGWVWLIILAALAYGVWHYRGIFSTSTTDTATTGSGRGGRGAAGGAVPVAVATATKGDIPVYLRAPGTVAAFNTVTVHSRVDGQLMSVNFKEGQFVREGEVLAELDPRPFQVQLEQAEGQLAHDQALLRTRNSTRNDTPSSTTRASFLSSRQIPSKPLRPNISARSKPIRERSTARN